MDEPGGEAPEGDEAGAALQRWAADARVEEAARQRARERWLRQQADEGASLAGVLADLAERGTPVALRTTSGRRHRGRIRTVGADYVVLAALPAPGSERGGPAGGGSGAASGAGGGSAGADGAAGSRAGGAGGAAGEDTAGGVAAGVGVDPDGLAGGRPTASAAGAIRPGAGPGVVPGQDVLVALAAVTTVRTPPGVPAAAGDRPVRARSRLAELLGDLAAERERALVVPLDGRGAVAGTIRSVGEDVLVVRPDGPRASVAYVPLAAVGEVILGG